MSEAENVIVVLFRPKRGRPWVRVGEAEDLAGALDLVRGPGDWWLHTPRGDPAGNLFAEDAEDQGGASGTTTHSRMTSA